MNRTVLIGAVVLGLGAPAAAQAPQTPAWHRSRAAAPPAAASLETRGAAVYNNWCVACHDKDPQNGPATRSLQFKYQGTRPAALEDRVDLTAATVKVFVRQGVATMPFFRKTEVSDTDLEALAAYLSRKR